MEKNKVSISSHRKCTPEKIQHSLRIILGLLFCFSAVMKLISIDHFELYLFSFRIFHLNMSAWMARIVIGAELCLGLSFLANIYHKLFWYAYLLMLGGFSLFLLYLVIIGRQDNCHCFGELVQFNPWQSIIKNIIFIALLLPTLKLKDFHFRPKIKAILLSGIVVLSFAGVFIYSPPDNIYTKYYREDVSFQQEKFETMIQDSSFLHTNILEGKKLVGMYSTGCKYCKLASQKVAMLQARNETLSVVNVFWGDPQKVDTFYQESESPHFPYVFVSPILFLSITEDMPLLLLLEDGKIQKTFNYREISEKSIQDFLAD